MHVDARTLEDGAVLEGDLCIIGAGAAGISIALEWIGTSKRVLLLEGGGFDLEAQLQDLYRGEIVGQPYYPLHASRLHYFGGTTGHWAGFCSTLDPWDLERRDWVPNSGWPLRRKDLDPFYERAQQLLELGPYRYDTEYWEQLDPDVVRLPLDEEVVWTKIWQFSPPTRFGDVYRDAVLNAPNLHLYTYANVCEIETDEAVRGVSALRLRTFEGKAQKVRARAYVLACGAIQNARLLLASNRQAPAGLGNDHDLVGRYFMDHFEMPAGYLVLAQPQPMKMYTVDFTKAKLRGSLSLTEKTQQAHGLLNGAASIFAGDMGGEVKSLFQSMTPEKVEALRLSERWGGTRSEESAPTPSPRRVFQFSTRHEQAPNADSRVMLSMERDALGLPLVRLDWRLTELDKRSMRIFFELLGREFGRANIGRVRLMDWLLEDDGTWPSFVSGGWHHMGTTRMHEDPRRGVVDADGRVHSLVNLYVAGSSVYPTSGAANPTLTLTALSLRLSDHLKSHLA